MLIDIGLLLILIYGFYRGFSKGIIHTVFSMIGWLLGLALAFKLTTALSPKVAEWLHANGEWIPVITFILILVIVVIAVILIGKAVEKIFDLTHLGLFNKIAGAIVSCAVLFFVYTQFIYILNEAHAIPPGAKDQSKLYFVLERTAPVMMNGISFVLPFAGSFLNELKNYFDHISRVNLH